MFKDQISAKISAKTRCKNIPHSSTRVVHIRDTKVPQGEKNPYTKLILDTWYTIIMFRVSKSLGPCYRCTHESYMVLSLMQWVCHVVATWYNTLSIQIRHVKVAKTKEEHDQRICYTNVSLFTDTRSCAIKNPMIMAWCGWIPPGRNLLGLWCL